MSLDLAPIQLFAHAFGQDFSLPLPVSMFIYGGAAAVLLSFVLIGLIYDVRSAGHDERVKSISSPAITLLGAVAKYIGLFLYIVAITAGLLGSPYPGVNLNVTLFWVLFFVGFTYLTVLFGNIWKAANPIRTIVEFAERLSRQRFTGIKPYPEKLSYYPALVIYFVVICLELLFDSVGTSPQSLSGLLIFYALVSVIGCLLYGKAVWFRYCDFFSVYFDLISKLSAFDYRKRQPIIRKPFTGLLEKWPESMSLVLFVIFMLASTSFDGFTETKQYKQKMELLPSFVPSTLYGLVVLIGMTILIYGLYVLFMALVKVAIRNDSPARKLCAAFAPSLIPIAIGYNIAHYFSYLVTIGQNAIRQVSDPFEMGWNLFGTAEFVPNATLLSTRVTWYIQVIAIIAGHVIAVYIAHLIAVRLFGSRQRAVVSQLPMIVLMVLYTTASLWIIAQPVYIAQEKAKVQEKEYQEFLESFRQPPMPPVPSNR